MQIQSSNRATRAASLGLAVVVLCLAAFSIVAAYTTRTQVARVTFQESLLGSYQNATTAIHATEASELQYIVEPTIEHQAELREANEAINDAASEIAARGDQVDARLAEIILGLHAQYVAASSQLLAAMVLGDVAEASRIHREVGDPLVREMVDRITAATNVRAAEAESALAALRGTAQWMLILAPIVFAIAFVLMLGLWRILEQYHRATRETYLEIEQLSRLRGEFVSTVSHEFRTPLTGIQGFSEMMRDEVLSVDLMREYAGDINKDAQRLNRLISDMLDLDRMESGHMTLNVQAVDLNRILVDAAAEFRSKTVDHPIELDLDAALPHLSGDYDRMTQVVTNLLSNAIKYSPKGGVVELRTKRDARTVVLTVRDHGIGIPTDQLEMIFERYSRIETSATNSIQGTGLGLPIVRQIVRRFEGKVWATSESGDGAVFHVQLPLPA